MLDTNSKAILCTSADGFACFHGNSGLTYCKPRQGLTRDKNGMKKKRTHSVLFLSEKTNKYLISSNIYRNVVILSQAATRHRHVCCFSPFGSGMYQSHRESVGYSVTVQRWKKIHLSYCYCPLLHGVFYKVTSISFRVIILRRDLSVGVNKSHVYIYIYTYVCICMCVCMFLGTYMCMYFSVYYFVCVHVTSYV